MSSGAATSRRGYVAGVGALSAITAIWGSTFAVTKDMLTRLPIADLYAVRFAIAAAVLIAIRPRALRRLPARVWRSGITLGLIYGTALVLQTAGLRELPSSVSGFVTASCVIITPLIALVWIRLAPGRRTWLAVGLAAAGMSVFTLVSGSEGGVVSAVAIVATLVSAVLYALHVVATGRWTSPSHAYPLAVIQILTLLTLMWAWALPGGVQIPATAGDWAGVAYLATLAGALAFLTQAWAQAHVPPTPAAVVYSAEPLWATACAVIVYGEPLAWPVYLGGGCILAAMLLVSRPEPVKEETWAVAPEPLAG
ncbi:DMT family transporter [Streptosporangiaceae bacterium NEAU-GS5]|nr:DMT family transporter [Streptosporangiaceae bacterium NEAU-GS5]